MFSEYKYETVEQPMEKSVQPQEFHETQQLQAYDVSSNLDNLMSSIENPEQQNPEDPEGKFGFTKLDASEHPPVHFELS